MNGLHALPTWSLLSGKPTTVAQSGLTDAVSTSMLATSLSSKADLVGGLVPSSQLPSYVDDVLEFSNLAAFPPTGETGKIYVALDTNRTYRWSGSAYVEITDTTAVWGNISGLLSSQTDLQNALDSKIGTVGGTLTGLVDFSGTGHAGIRLNNLTTAQRDALSGAAGMAIWNTTDSRFNVHNGTGWTSGFVRLDGDTMTGPLRVPDGSSSAPGIAFSSETNSGLVRFGTGIFGWSFSGAIRQYLTTAEMRLGTSVTIGWSSNVSPSAASADLVLVRGGADTLEMRRTTNPQTFLVNNTYTSTTSYERGYMRWASNILSIGTEKGSGGGTARSLHLETDGLLRLRIEPTLPIISLGTGSGRAVVQSFAGVNFLNASDGTGLAFVANTTANGDSSFAFSGSSFATTSGTNRLVDVSRTFAPASGSAIFNSLDARPTINQTGGASGVTRAFNASPVLTSAADWRSFDTNVNSGFAYHSSGIAPSRLGGSLQVTQTLTLGVYTVATLPSASANAGAVAQVTDSSVTANGSNAAGGGASRVAVFSNGTNWKVTVA